MPFVPVVAFWSTQQSVSMAGLQQAASEGQLVVPTDDLDQIADLLGIDDLGTGSLEEIETAVRDGAIGIVRATDVTQRFHALAVDGVSLFGNDRLASTDDWPLVAEVMSVDRWDQGSLWTLVAAGDIMLDRLVVTELNRLGEDREYVFNGGGAVVTGDRCCGFFGDRLPIWHRSGDGGALRELFSGADLAMANLESAVLHDAPHHASYASFTFTADAEWMPVLADTGFDLLSIANNHSRNAGARGLTTALDAIREAGMVPAGAGDGDAAAEPGIVEVNGLHVAVIACDAIITGAEARPGRVGTLSCRNETIVDAIAAARSTADLVIVFPHWGREYSPFPVEYQRRLAEEWVAAGVDLVVGSHSHVAGAMDDVDGHTVFYSLGNLVFDQDFSQATMMGVVPEMTFRGTSLVQVKLHATLVTRARPFLVAADEGGQWVFDRMRNASERLLPY